MGLVKYLLDTCTFLWLALPNGKLSDPAIEALNNVGSELFLLRKTRPGIDDHARAACGYLSWYKGASER